MNHVSRKTLIKLAFVAFVMQMLLQFVLLRPNEPLWLALVLGFVGWLVFVAFCAVSYWIAKP